MDLHSVKNLLYLGCIKSFVKFKLNFLSRCIVIMFFFFFVVSRPITFIKLIFIAVINMRLHILTICCNFTMNMTQLPMVSVLISNC